MAVTSQKEPSSDGPTERALGLVPTAARDGPLLVVLTVLSFSVRFRERTSAPDNEYSLSVMASRLTYDWYVA